MKILLLFVLLQTLLQANIGTVTAVLGQVNIIQKDNKKPAKKGDDIMINDLVQTQENSKTQIILNDDTIITIGPNSEYLFDEYIDQGDIQVSMTIKHGFFKAVTGKLGKIAPNRFKIKTKAATIGIRGTQFMGHVTPNEESIGCIQGSITVTPIIGSHRFIINSGSMILYRNGKWEFKRIDHKIFKSLILGEASKKKNHKNGGNEPFTKRQSTLEQQAVVQRQVDQSNSQPFEIADSVQSEERLLPFIPVEGIDILIQAPVIPKLDITLSPDNTLQPPKFRP